MATTSVILLAVSLIIPSALSQCTKETALPFFSRSVYEFSTELVGRIAQETENHFFSSALSPWILISTLSLGAGEETLDEIQHVLRLHPHKCFNTKFFEIIQQLDEAEDDTVLKRSSQIVASNRLPIHTEFTSRLMKAMVSELQIMSFDDTYTVANTINEYVSQATHGNIAEIVEASDLEGIDLVLIDALYFKGAWQSEFSNSETEMSPFYDERRNQIGDVNLMFGEFRANITAVTQIGATVLELPYGNGRFSMLFILPNDDQTISTVIDNLKRISLTTIFTLFQQNELQKTSIQIPRFKVVSDLDNMKEWLMDMGLKSMFETTASFPYLSDFPVYVSNFIQKAVVEVTEKGTEASVASGAFLEGRSYNPATQQFTANKPFLYMIVDRNLKLPLFTGAYSKPSLY